MQTTGQPAASLVYFVTNELQPLAMACLRSFALSGSIQANHNVCFQSVLVCTTIMRAGRVAHQINAATRD
jgi:hypothetical protein